MQYLPETTMQYLHQRNRMQKWAPNSLNLLDVPNLSSLASHSTTNERTTQTQSQIELNS